MQERSAESANKPVFSPDQAERWKIKYELEKRKVIAKLLVTTKRPYYVRSVFHYKS